jgi:predicted AlkP superfamily pyrophosphatase or phosphodiesterase
MLTGLAPRDHGVVANGWYFRELNEIRFWHHSNRLVQGRKVWDDFGGRTAVLFWRFNMAIAAAVTVAERPAYPADGRKIPDLYTQPPALGQDLQRDLGRFPLFRFWGPLAGIESTRWIADAAIEVARRESPDLLLVYLPHLDYDLQRYGPDDPRIPAQVGALDREAARILDALKDHRPLVVSEYGITRVDGAYLPNRALREAGLLEVIENPVGELLDPWRSRAFAVCDHQIAHVYVKDPGDGPAVRRVLDALPGVELLDKAAAGLDHPRAGEIVALAPAGRWFAYPYWLDDARAPDFARTVDIHKKPGYDPVELFKDASAVRIAWILLKKRLGFRTLLDVVPLDTSLVKGSHGRLPADPSEGPILLGDTDRPRPLTAIKQLLLDALR